MADRKDLPRWPESLPVPDEIKMTKVYVLEEQDVTDKNDTEKLMRLLYMHSEREFYLFLEQGKPINKQIHDRLESFGILTGASEFYYYKHPEFERDYVRIQRYEIQFDWEQEVIKKGPMFFRTKLKLSDAAKRRLVIEEQMDTEKQIDKNPLELKPNICGLGIDLLKLWKLATGFFKRRS